MTDVAFDGRRATGVSVSIGGETKTFTGREIILSLAKLCVFGCRQLLGGLVNLA